MKLTVWKCWWKNATSKRMCLIILTMFVATSTGRWSSLFYNKFFLKIFSVSQVVNMWSHNKKQIKHDKIYKSVYNWIRWSNNKISIDGNTFRGIFFVFPMVEPDPLLTKTHILFVTLNIFSAACSNRRCMGVSSRPFLPFLKFFHSF